MSFSDPISAPIFNSIVSEGADASVVSQLPLIPIKTGLAKAVVAHNSLSTINGLDPKRYSQALLPFIDTKKAPKVCEMGVYLTVTQLTKDNFIFESLPCVKKELQNIWKQELKHVTYNPKSDQVLLATKIEEIVAKQLRAFEHGKTIGESQHEALKILSTFQISLGKQKLYEKRGKQTVQREKARSQNMVDRLRHVALSIIQLSLKTGRPLQEIDYDMVVAEEAVESDTAEAELLAEIEEEAKEASSHEPGVIHPKKKKKKKAIKKQEKLPSTASHQSIAPPITAQEGFQTKVEILLSLHSSKGIPSKLHPRVSRWQDATAEKVRTFKDLPAPGQTAYQEMDDKACFTEIAHHRIIGILHFFKEPFQSRYTYPYTYRHPTTRTAQAGFGLYAEMVREDIVSSGVITVGMTKKRLVYHVHFKKLSEKMASGADLIESLTVPAPAQPSELKWEGESPYRFDLEEKEVIKMDVPGGLFFRIYPLNYH